MAFKTAEQIEAERPAALAREAQAARADHAERSQGSRKLVVVTLDQAPDERFLPNGVKVVGFRGREDGRDSSLSAVYFVPDHERRGGFGREDLDDRLGELKPGSRLSLGGHWAKRRWQDGQGQSRESWEFRAQRFERGDAGLDAMERSALARIDVGVKEGGPSATDRSEQVAGGPRTEAGRPSSAPSDSVRDRQRAAMSASGPRRWTEDELVSMVPSLLRSSGGYDPYAGIGSRETTQEVCDDMTAAARVLEARGFTLRSGFAGGADTAFELGTTKDDQREVIAPWKGFGTNPDNPHEKKRWDQIRRHEAQTGKPFAIAKPVLLQGEFGTRAAEMASRHHAGWERLGNGPRQMHTRNMAQVLGPSLDAPARFELAYTVDGKASGGTGQAIRVAEASGIPVLNMHNPRIRAAVLSELGLEPQRDLAKDLAAAQTALESRGASASQAPAREAVAPSAPAARRDDAFDLAAPASRLIPDDRAAPFCKVKDENGLYSNMANGASFVHQGVTWRSTEAFYQAARFPHLPEVQKAIWEAPNAYASKIKAYEHIADSRKDWGDDLPGGGKVKDQVMAVAITLKLQDPAFSALVEANRDREVVEISSRDQYWGAAKVQGGYRGQNQLGSLLTQLSQGAREHELPAGTTFPSRAFLEGREAAPAVAAAGLSPRTVSYEEGSIVDHGAQVLVNTVNSRLSDSGNPVMGKGVAKAFKEAFPSIMKDYGDAIRSGELKPGRALLFDLPDGRKWAALATKDDWRDKSRPEWVESGLKELGEKMRAAGLTSVAIPPPGCGNGGLDWRRVEPVLHRELAGLDVSIYARPSGAMPSNDVDASVHRGSGEQVSLPPPSLKASMYFSYNGDKRPEVRSDTTFEAIRAGERTSTTRFPDWGGYDRWKALGVGDVVRLYEDREMKGEKVDVVVMGVKEVDLTAMSPSQMDQWSRAEGWTEQAGRRFGRQHGIGLQIRYDLPENVDADRLAKAREEQRDVDREPSVRKVEPVAMSPDDLRRAKQRAAMGRGLG